MNELKVIDQVKGGELAEVVNYEELAIKYLDSTGSLQKFNENEKKQFVNICQAFRLNPIKKEVYGVLYVGENGRKFNLIVSVETYKKRAERSGKLNGYDVEIKGTGDNMSATITIYRKDWEHPYKHTVYFSEYNTEKNLWVSKPRTMLEKVAIAQGLRNCFPDELGGMPYTADELPEEMTTPKPIDITIKTESEPEEISGTPERPALLFTLQEAQELGKILTQTYSDGAPIFSDEDKAYYRNELIAGHFDTAIIKARDDLEFRTMK